MFWRITVLLATAAGPSFGADKATRPEPHARSTVPSEPRGPSSNPPRASGESGGRTEGRPPGRPADIARWSVPARPPVGGAYRRPTTRDPGRTEYGRYGGRRYSNGQGEYRPIPEPRNEYRHRNLDNMKEALEELERLRKMKKELDDDFRRRQFQPRPPDFRPPYRGPVLRQGPLD